MNVKHIGHSKQSQDQDQDSAYGALQGAVSYKQYVFCALDNVYGALQGAVSYKCYIFRALQIVLTAPCKAPQASKPYCGV